MSTTDTPATDAALRERAQGYLDRLYRPAGWTLTFATDVQAGTGDSNPVPLYVVRCECPMTRPGDKVPMVVLGQVWAVERDRYALMHPEAQEKAITTAGQGTLHFVAVDLAGRL